MVAALFDTAQWTEQLQTFIWPAVRIMGIFTSAPMLSHRSIPVTTKVGLGILITVIIAPTIPQFTAIDVVSWTGFAVLAKEFLLGIAIGFILKLIFTGIELAGDITGMTMGLSFATFFDPQSQGRSSSINQFLSMTSLLIFVSSDMHLLLIEILVNSFKNLPIGMGLSSQTWRQIALLGGKIFAISMQLSLPPITALLMSNMALGVLTRTAPQLNLFGIGFPITLMTGYIMLTFMLTYWMTPVVSYLEQGLDLVQVILAN